jgi:predicted Zn-dependent protease
MHPASRVRPWRSAAWLASGLVLSLAAAADTRAQERGEYGPVPVRDSERPLMKTVAEYEELFVRRNYRVPDETVGSLVTTIGAALAPPPVDDYIRFRFHVLRDTTANAFALPDGQIYVHAGLIALLENEAQLAAILAHEVHHTAGHHGLLSYRSIRSKSVAGMVFGPLTLGLSDVFLGLSVAGYSRELEEEADARGEARMLEAGWDPGQMERTFLLMQSDPDVETPQRSVAWSSHPQLQARAAAARSRASTLVQGADATALRVNAARYRDLVRPLSCAVALGFVEENRPRSACVLARRLLAEAPEDPATHYVLAESLRALGPLSEQAPAAEATQADKKRNVKEREKTTRAEREAALLATPEGAGRKMSNFAAARTEYLRALGVDENLAEAWRGLGFVAHGLGDPQAAGRAFVTYLRERPEATDRPVILRHLHEITEALQKQGKEAAP